MNVTFSGDIKSCSAVRMGTTTSWCLFMPTSLGGKEGLLCNPPHMAETGLDRQTAPSEFIMYLEMFVVLKENFLQDFKEKEKKEISSIHQLSICLYLGSFACLSYQRTVSQADI